ncbi:MULTISPECIES: RNA polymerase sigma factor FliA [unclassified Shewanella]|uniref:RNA polymerase sigma factor FliA n=1 Tax=unclassified Shewanella TaxID=196818 RepID=UPI000C83B4E8|nr:MULTISPECIES: RNA polymerase sigma factor FliA [unclassified Shewanella]MDO6618621.1 RNA polymerase sigma factor FliA [Shewanella sp. 6_MG-2023]MDO6641124.1 RNA polymerase sigma factor FliA [Shewanella sp. 5_MG-2023]MDO6678536.1 RNA polymerase sigma factor FliA [Shewanella sp. 4_MG-2023]MDO6774722.1 RNA polymerase sigma factor FliA [Shewanella sp. 3_MG-2023]PMG32015.1 RNA polymerase sigma factor FliA [Shewanella sp. 10N.286.52.C2]
MNKAAAYTQFDNKTSIVEQYAPLVKRIAHHMLARLPASVQLDDLLQAGMMGLLEASSKFDGSKGAKFETFAGIRIRGSMIDEIRRGDWVPRSVHRNQRRVAQVIDELGQELGRDARDTEIAEKLEISLEEYHHILNDVSVGKVIGIEDLGVSEDVIVSDELTEDESFDSLAEVQFKSALAQAITTLPERDALVLSLYYDEALNLKEIGAVLEVSESRVSQILSQAMLRLKGKLKHWTQV